MMHVPSSQPAANKAEKPGMITSIQRRNILSSNKELLNDLRDVIQDYLSRNRLRSLASLARQSSIPDSTIRRIMQEESVPDLATVIALLGAIYSHDEKRAFLSKHFPKPYELFVNAFYSTDEDFHELAYYLSSEVSQSILQLCANRQDTDREGIEQLYGEHGLQKLDELIEAGHVVVDARGTLRLKRKGLEKDVALCLSNIGLWSRMFDQELLGSDGALLVSVTACTTLEGLRQGKAAGQEYLKKVAKIIREHPGRIPVCVGVMQNVFDNEEFQAALSKHSQVSCEGASET